MPYTFGCCDTLWQQRPQMHLFVYLRSIDETRFTLSNTTIILKIKKKHLNSFSEFIEKKNQYIPANNIKIKCPFALLIKKNGSITFKTIVNRIGLVLGRSEFTTCIQMVMNSRKVWINRDRMDGDIGGIKRVEVLVTCRFLLKFLHLCDKDRVRINFFNVKIIEVPNFITFGGFAAPIAYELVMLVWACFSDDVIVEKRPSLMCVILSNLQAFLTYTSMVKTNRFTIETIQFIQEVVDKSELFL